MAEETAVVGQAGTGSQEAAGGSQASTEVKTERQQDKTLGDHVKAAMEKRNAPKGEKTETAEEVGEDGKPKKGQTINERISSYANRTKDAEAKAQALEEEKANLSTELQSLKADLLGIKALLESGAYSPEKANKETEKVQEKLDDLELPEELQPYRDVLQNMIDRKLQPLREAEERRAKDAEEKTLSDFRTKVKGNYVEAAKSYPDLFEAEPDKDGFPVFKAEIDKQVSPLIDLFKVPITGKDGKEEGFYNPILEHKEGLEMLLHWLSRPVEAAKAAKAEIEETQRKVETARKSRTEGPGTNTATLPKPKNLTELIQNSMKKVGYQTGG